MPFFSSASVAYTTSLPGFVHELVAIDFNGDGLRDLISARFHFPLQNAGIPIDILLNQGNGTFIDGTASVMPGGAPTTVHPREVVTADFNGDGKLDIFFADHGYDASPFPGAQNRLILSSGSTYVDATAASLPVVSDFTHSATAADIDGDGDQDIYVGNLHFGSLPINHFLINNGAGVFSRDDDRLPSALELPNPNGFVTSALGDLTGDGKPDLFLGSDAGNSSVIAVNNGSGSFTTTITGLPAEPFGTGSTTLDSHIRDINNDGLNDIVVVFTRSGYTDRAVRFWINQGGGVFADETSQRVEAMDETGAWIVYVTFADFNGDGAADLITEQTGGEAASVLINDGDGNFFLPANAEQSFTGGGFEVADFNGDSKPDVAAWGGSNLFIYSWLDGPAYPLDGDAGDNRLRGDAFANTLLGLGGADALRGGAGSDTLRGGAGNDTLVGGSGSDTADLSDATGAVVFVLGASGDGTVTAAGTDTDTLSQIENIVGGSAGDTLTGNAFANRLDGGGGSDTLDGGAGADMLLAGADDDTIVWDAGDDLANVLGGNGTDTLRVLNQTAPTSFDLAAHGFERANVITDDPGGNWWQQISDYYNTSWQRTNSDTRADNGNLVQTTYDVSVGGTGVNWQYISDYRNASSTLTNQDGQFDSGGTFAKSYDYAAGTGTDGISDELAEFTYFFRNVTEQQQGKVLNVEGFYDDGRKFTQTNDIDANQAWTFQTNWYESNGTTLDFLEIRWDNGTTQIVPY